MLRDTKRGHLLLQGEGLGRVQCANFGDAAAKVRLVHSADLDPECSIWHFRLVPANRCDRRQGPPWAVIDLGCMLWARNAAI
jgi:hypothetical protein